MVQSTGGCLCGAIRFTLDGPPIDVADCHCRLCQRSVGAVSVTWATVDPARLTVTGTPAWFRSSTRAERGFCPGCGTSLFFRPLRGDFVDVTVAAFDDPAGLPPTYVIWTSARVPWAPLAPGVPAHAEDGPDRVAE